jgi:N-carbamoylputrescine amidase
VVPDVAITRTGILSAATAAADAGADLVVFGEAALTGLINNDDPAHDLPLGQRIPGPLTDQLGLLAKRKSIWLSIGLLERESKRLFDSAVLVGPDGRIAAKHRRIQPQWHGKNADPAVYCQGTELVKVQTPLGSFAFLICGDLWDDSLLLRVRELRPDWLLHPYARCFADGSCDQDRWDREELPEYRRRIASVGAATLAVSYLSSEGLPSDGLTFGGAMSVSSDGVVMDSFPLGKPGMLVVQT